MCARQGRARQYQSPAYGTWTADFILQQNESRAFLGKYFNDPRIPWRHKRREMMASAGIIPVAKWLAKIKQRSDVSCRLCKREREQRGASTEILPEETYGHINSAFCDGMTTTVTAAHHFIWRHLYASMQAAQTSTSKLRFVTPNKKRVESMQLPAKLLDYSFWSHKSNINQSVELGVAGGRI